MAEPKTLEIKRISHGGSLSDQISNQLETLIQKGRIAVGEQLPTESTLCKLFGVSRTAVREAIANLRSKGFLETQRGVGTKVISCQPFTAFRQIQASTLEDILHVLEWRLIVEPQAASMAAERYTQEDRVRLERAHEDFLTVARRDGRAQKEDFHFHYAIVQATHNPFLLSFYEPLGSEVIPRALLVTTALDHDAAKCYLELVANEHGAILEAILKRDRQAAEKAVWHHFDRTRRTYSAYRNPSQMSKGPSGQP